MKDGIILVGCSRPGCNRELGAQRYENGKVVEEEFHPYAVKDGDNYYCNDCVSKKEDFRDPGEDSDVSFN